MELVWSIKHLHDNNITIGEIVTDARKCLVIKLYSSHKFITLYHTIATDHPSIHHSMSIWHKENNREWYLLKLVIHCLLPHALTLYVGWQS